MASETGFEGGCTCGAVRYRMTSRPMIVHACHCRWCQRETGTAFALNAVIEAARVVTTNGESELVVRVGTLDEPDRFPPDVHIYTMSKQPWVVLPEGARAFREYYESSEVWPKESLERRAALLGR